MRSLGLSGNVWRILGELHVVYRVRSKRQGGEEQGHLRIAHSREPALEKYCRIERPCDLHAQRLPSRTSIVSGCGFLPPSSVDGGYFVWSSFLFGKLQFSSVNGNYLETIMINIHKRYSLFVLLFFYKNEKGKKLPAFFDRVRSHQHSGASSQSLPSSCVSLHRCSKSFLTGRWAPNRKTITHKNHLIFTVTVPKICFSFVTVLSFFIRQQPSVSKMFQGQFSSGPKEDWGRLGAHYGTRQKGDLIPWLMIRPIMTSVKGFTDRVEEREEKKKRKERCNPKIHQLSPFFSSYSYCQ